MTVELTDKELCLIRNLLEAELWRLEDEDQSGLILSTKELLKKLDRQ
jgi:hypothetical protein